jgi:hypothetical protein
VAILGTPNPATQAGFAAITSRHQQKNQNGKITVTSLGLLESHFCPAARFRSKEAGK